MSLTVASPSRPRRGGFSLLEATAGGHRRTVLAGLVITLIGFAILSLFVGAQALPPAQVFGAIVGADVPTEVALLVLELRVPRTILGILVGVCLDVAGTLMQALTRNPLAEPGILGVNAGASAAVVTGVALTSVGGVAFAGVTATVVSVVFAFVGAAAASVLVLLLGGAFRSGTDPVRLTLAGAALSIVLGAYTNAILLNFPTIFQSFKHWAVGSLQGRGYDVILPIAAIAVPAALAACLCGPWLNALALGTEMGRALGANPRRLGLIGGVLVVLLAGSATAAAGPIAFVGLAAPLAVRALVGPDYRWVLPLSALSAAIIVVGADMIGRVLMNPAEVETAVIASLIGAPVFIALVRRRRWARL